MQRCPHVRWVWLKYLSMFFWLHSSRAYIFQCWTTLYFGRGAVKTVILGSLPASYDPNFFIKSFQPYLKKFNYRFLGFCLLKSGSISKLFKNLSRAFIWTKFVVNLVEIDRVVFSPALLKDRHFVKTSFRSGDPKTVIYTKIANFHYNFKLYFFTITIFFI